MSTLDCLIVGGGAGGLVAAVYLGRYRRNVLVVDEGASRLARIPKSRNVMGFPEGIAGQELWDRMRAHASHYDVQIAQGRIDSLKVLPDGTFEAQMTGRTIVARNVILATGARDIEPEVTGLDIALQSGHVRYCPVCDGFETQGQRVAVLGEEIHGLRKSAFVAGFANEVTWLSMGSQSKLRGEDLQSLQSRKVKVHDSVPKHIHCEPGGAVHIEFDDGHKLDFDVMYPALGTVHASDLATALGARVEDDGQIVIDAHCRTSVAGLYAVGDVAAGLNQINVAAGHAAIAATAVHNSL